MSARVVADEMEVLICRGGDAERLFHQSIRLVSVAIRAFFSPIAVISASSAAFWSLGWRCEASASTSLALHFSIC
jgi:hypothetical protein